MGRYYPNRENYEFTSIKRRIVTWDENGKESKDFRAIGGYGAHSDLFGEWLCKDGGRVLFIVGGEEDVAAGWQMLDDHNDSDKYDSPHFVCPLMGEKGSSKQIANKYAFFDKFDKIIIGFDNDDAGKEGTNLIAPLLPSGKVYVAVWPDNDPCDSLMKGNKRQFIDAYFKGMKTRYVPEGITSSTQLESKMLSHVKVEKVSLPPFMSHCQEMLAGGFSSASLINLFASSGCGKTIVTNAFVINFIMNNPHNVGIASMEAPAGEYAVNLSSAYCKFNVNRLKTVESKIEYLKRPENIEKRKELWTREDGTPRFYLIDADVDNMQNKIEQLIKSNDCKIIVIDPISDLMDMLHKDDQAKLLVWIKSIMKKYGTIFLCVNHIRKNSEGTKANSTGAEVFEESIMGASQIFKSGSVNIGFWRNKEAEDDIERDTLFAKVTKNRDTGVTGATGPYFYDGPTHTLHDKAKFFSDKKNLPERYKK